MVDRVVVDDAFYYFQIARHVVAGDGFTFDGLSRTNGFQPLWQILLLPIFAYVHDPDRQVQLASAFSGTLWGAAGVVLFAFLARLVPGYWALFGVFVWLTTPSLFHMAATGMESGLVAVVFVVLLIVWQRHHAMLHTLRGALAFGALAGVLALTRIDEALLLPALALSIAARPGSWRIKAGLLVRLTAGFLVLIGPYLVWSKCYARTWLPISGQMKLFYQFGTPSLRGVPIVSLMWDALHNGERCARFLAGRTFGDMAAVASQTLRLSGIAVSTAHLLLALVFLVAVAPVRWLLRWDVPSDLRPYGPIALFVALHFAFVAVALPGFFGYNTWYFPAEILFLIAGVTIALHRLAADSLYTTASAFGRRARSLVIVLAAGLCAGLLLSSSRELRTALEAPADAVTSAEVRAYDTAYWLNEHVPDHSVVGAFSAGILGFYATDVRVVNLDGFVNGVDYLEALRRAAFQEYVEATGIRYIVDAFSGDPLTEGLRWPGRLPAQRLRRAASWPLWDGRRYLVLEFR